MIAADAPASACAPITHHTVGENTMISAETAKTATTMRKISTHPTRCPSFAPTMTSAATAMP